MHLRLSRRAFAKGQLRHARHDRLYEAMKLITEPLRSGDAEKALQYRAEVEREYAAAVGMIECL